MIAAATHPREELTKVSSLVLTARRLLASGTLVDLSAIEERVGAVVAAVKAMPPEEGRALVDDLCALIDRLDRLGEDLQEQLSQINDKLDGQGG